jgi:hypothetical protein
MFLRDFMSSSPLMEHIYPKTKKTCHITYKVEAHISPNFVGDIKPADSSKEGFTNTRP